MIASKDFSDLFLNEEQVETRTLFIDTDAVGFSITIEYPQTGLIFQPMRNQKGEVDSLALVKIYFVLSQIDKEGLVPLHVWISPSSKYLLKGRMRYNYDDENSPSAEALKIWEKMSKPPELTEDGYIFNTLTNKVLNKNTKKEVNSKDIIGKIFEGHIKISKPLKGLPFRIKFGTRNFIADKLLFICKGIHIINKFVFSREITKETRTYETVAYDMFLKPTPHGLLSIKQPKDLKIFGTELSVSKNSIIISAFIFILLNISGEFIWPELNSAVKYLFKDNTFLATSVIIVWFIFFDNWLPHILLFISNKVIVIADWVRRRKILV